MDELILLGKIEGKGKAHKVGKFNSKSWEYVEFESETTPCGRYIEIWMKIKIGKVSEVTCKDCLKKMGNQDVITGSEME